MDGRLVSQRTTAFGRDRTDLNAGIGLCWPGAGREVPTTKALKQTSFRGASWHLSAQWDCRRQVISNKGVTREIFEAPFVSSGAPEEFA